MSKTPRNFLLLGLILAFSFVYRVALMLWQTYPPGADIGLHSSIINSITHSGSINFLYNDYHMGGGSSVTFPGYHIFTSFVIQLTGLPNYVAQTAVVSLFSTLIVAAAFLLTRKVWNVSAALIVAFLVAFSRFDIEMLMWGGFPNVITLLLIPVVFYLFLEKDRFTAAPFLVTTSLLVGGIFLTHSLSALIFLVITVFTVLFSVVFAGKMGERRIGFTMWILPLFIGAVLIFPFLLQVAPAYLGADVSTFTGGIVDIKLALLSTKTLPFELVVPLGVFAFLYFLFSRYYIGKYVTVPSLLMFLWWFIPTVATQGYAVGLYTDFTRFLYFVILPLIMLIGLGLYHSARFFSQALEFLKGFFQTLPQVRINAKLISNKTLHRISPHVNPKNTAFLFIMIFILYAFLSVPLFSPPAQGAAIQSFYQLMDQPEFEAIQWAKDNSPANAIFLTDAQYGWWFSGFAQRPTISAVDPQYLTNAREFEPAKIARYVLDTEYLVDNGLIQIREDGGRIARHNPEFLVKLHNQYFPYGFFNFNNGDETVTLRDAAGKVQIVDLSTMPVSDEHMENSSSYASIYVTRASQLFNFTEEVTVYQGSRFANLTISMVTANPEVTFDSVRLLLHTKGFYLAGPINSNFAYDTFVDAYEMVAGELIYTNGQPETKVFTAENPSSLEIVYNLNGQTTGEVSIFAGVYEYGENPKTSLPAMEQRAKYVEIIASNTQTYLNSSFSDAPLDVFDYAKALDAQNVSYVVIRDFEQVPRLAKDPMFSLVFINDEVAIFQVHKLT